jgi:hypothetical protein
MERKVKAINTAAYDQEIARGNEANLILQNTMLNEVLNRIEESAVARLMDAVEQDKRDEAWHEARAVKKLKAELKKIADNGKFAKMKKDQQ